MGQPKLFCDPWAFVLREIRGKNMSYEYIRVAEQCFLAFNNDFFKSLVGAMSQKPHLRL